MKKLTDVRAEIEKIDREIIALISNRTGLAREVLDAKKCEGLPINDETQNKKVMARVADIATECGLDAGEVKNIFRILIKMSIDRQSELSGEGNLP